MGIKTNPVLHVSDRLDDYSGGLYASIYWQTESALGTLPSLLMDQVGHG